MDPTRNIGANPRINYGPTLQRNQAETPAASANAPGDQVQLGSSKSTLLDHAKTLSLGVSVGITGLALAEIAGVTALTAIVGVPVGIMAVIATGMALTHLIKNRSHQGQAAAAPQAPPRPAPTPGPTVASAPTKPAFSPPWQQAATTRSADVSTGSPNFAALMVGLQQANPNLTQGDLEGILQQSRLPNGQVDPQRALMLARAGSVPIGQWTPQPGGGPTVSQPNAEYTIASRPLVAG